MPSSSSQLTIDGITVELVRSKRRTLGLELSPKGVKARAPMRMPEADIIAFIKSKHRWINKHLETMPPDRSDQSLLLDDGAKLQLRGREYTLAIEEGSRRKVNIKGERIIVPIQHSPHSRHQRIKTKLVKWYKEVAQHELQTRARNYAALMDVPQRRTDQIYVRDYKRRWGSCDSKGKLSFNWRILQAPTEVSDYVVIHELAHCHEFNHSKRFWAIVHNQMPDYQHWDHWLNQHGHRLYTF